MAEVTPTPRRFATAPRWMQVVLIVSVALNLAVVGMITGAAVLGPRFGPSLMVREIGFGPFDRALSPVDRSALRTAFMAQLGDRKGQMRSMREDLTGLLDALRAQPFNADALWSLATQQQNRMRDRMELGQRLLIERIIAMSDEERQHFADRLQEEIAHAPHHDDAPPP